MFPGKLNLSQVRNEGTLRRILRLLDQHFAIPNNGVQRGTEFMAHAGKKYAFRPITSFGHLSLPPELKTCGGKQRKKCKGGGTRHQRGVTRSICDFSRLSSGIGINIFLKDTDESTNAVHDLITMTCLHNRERGREADGTAKLDRLLQFRELIRC